MFHFKEVVEVSARVFSSSSVYVGRQDVRCSEGISMCLVTALVEEFISEVPNWYRFEVLDEDMTKFIRGERFCFNLYI